MNLHSNSRVAAVILAAGGSARMGEAKQLLPLADSTVLGQTLDNVRRARLDETILVLGHSADTIRQQLSPVALKDVTVVVDPDFDEGMASSLRAGISAISAGIDGALIVLADQPFIAASTLARIADRYRDSEAQIVIPTHNQQRGNPVLLDRRCFPGDGVAGRHWMPRHLLAMNPNPQSRSE